MSRVAGPHTARARARAQMLEQIKREALAQLAAEGAPSLSLRQIARELGLVSSGLYRYFASRDELLTALIVDAYADLARAIDVADTGLEQHDYRRRWIARCTGLRAWARAEPARYHLIYGSPVPGYQAPPDTIAPAGAVILALLSVLAEAGAAGTLADRPAPDDPELVAQLVAMGEALALDLSVGTLARAIGALGEANDEVRRL